DALRAAQNFALLAVAHEQLGNSVLPRFVEIAAIERVPGFLRCQPVVSARVDDQRNIVKGIRVLAGLAMRKRQEDDVMSSKDLGGGVLQRQVCERTQVWLMLDQWLAGVGM